MKRIVTSATHPKSGVLDHSRALLPAWCRLLVKTASQVVGASTSVAGINENGLWSTCTLGADGLTTESIVEICERVLGGPAGGVLDGFGVWTGVPIRNVEGEARGALCIARRDEEAVDASTAEILTGLVDLVAPLTSEPSNSKRSPGADLAFLVRALKEIQPPLTEIVGLADVLRREVTGTSRRRAHIIHGNSARVVGALRSILDLVQLETGVVPSRPCIIDLAGIIRDVIESERPRIREHGLSLDFSAPDESVDVVFDEEALRYVLRELLSNAVGFTSAGGIAVEIGRSTSHARISVADTGIGMSAAFLPHLFEPFTREGSAPSRSIAGAGLGMAIVKRHVDANNATIEVESRQGRGTTVTLKLPVPGPQPQAETTMSAAFRHDLTGKPLILLVEDNGVTRRVIEMILQKEYEVISAATVDDAIATAREYQFDLLLLDISLNDRRTGVEVLHEIRAMVRYRDVPALACTAYSLPGIRERYLESGFDAYLAKPFRAEQVLELIRALLETGRRVDDDRGQEEAASSVSEEGLAVVLPPLPPTLPEILTVLSGSGESAATEQLPVLLDSDPAVTAWVLAHANSAFYGVRGKVASVERAVTLLGIEPVCNLVAAGVLAQTFASDDSEASGQAYRRIMKGSLCTAGFSREIASQFGLENPELAFTAGLLHDIGRLCMLSHQPDKFGRLWAASDPEPPEMGQEILNFGVSHVMLAEQLGSDWGLPIEIRAVIKYFARPEDAPGRWRQLVTLVAAARAMAHSVLISGDDESRVASDSGQAFRRLEMLCGIQAGELTELMSSSRNAVLSLANSVQTG